MGTTLAEKVWADHLVRKGGDGAPDLLYIDLMLMHEVTSPQAFEGLRGVPGAGLLTGHGDDLAAPELRLGPLLAQPQPAPDGSQYQAGRKQPLLQPGHHRQRTRLAGTLEQAGQ